MKKSITRVMEIAVTTALLFIGCKDSASPQYDGYVDGFLVSVNQPPGSSGGQGVETRTVEVESAGSGKTGGGSRVVGVAVDIDAGTVADRPFLYWTTSSPGVKFEDSTSAKTSFIMPPNDVKVTANFDPTFPVTVLGGTANNGRYLPNATVNITADTTDGRPFGRWTTASNGVTFADSANVSTSFTMPANSVTVTAVFTGSYPVIVSSIGTGATGGGNYYVGETVNIYAGTGTGRPFEKWTTASNGVIFADSSNESTSFIMPANEVTVTAVFKELYWVTVSSIGSGATNSGQWLVGQTVPINAGTLPIPHKFEKWTSNKGVTFADSGSASTTFVMPASDVTVTAVFWDWDILTDARDNKEYKTATIGGKTWMAENLNYTPSSGNFWCCYDLPDYCNAYGKLYDWETAKTACMAGWHLPSLEEWRQLVEAAGGTDGCGGGFSSNITGEGKACKTLRATSGWVLSVINGSDGSFSNIGTDNFGFSALPGGRRYLDGEFHEATIDKGWGGYWWTASEYSSGYAYSIGMRYDNGIFEDSHDISYFYGFSVRCVKDE